MIKNLNTGIIFKILGYGIVAIGILMLITLPVAFFYKENTISDILLSFLICLSVGGGLLLLTRKVEIKDIENKEVFAIVTLTWFVLGFFGAIPFLISNAIPNFTNAYFEAISGFTTTGATILTDIESLPKSILLWRSFIQWLGGIGILVLVIAVLSIMGIGDLKIFVAEVSGPKSTKFHPKIKNTARRLWLIYAGMTTIVIILLLLGGKNLYESICHALTTVATGGFSPKNSSIADYSTYNQIVIIVFMFLGAVNFALYFSLLKGNFKSFFKNEELIAFFIFVVVIALFIAGEIYYYGVFSTVGESLKHAFFQVVSIVTTTGFGTADYNNWPAMTQVIMLFLCFTGGMIGSTAGGVKFTRLLVLIKNIRYEIKRIVHPNAVYLLKVNKIPIRKDVVRNFFTVFVVWIFFICLGTIILSFFVSNLREAMGVTAATLGAVGPAFGEFGPVGSYAELHDIGKWTCIFLMVIGRLEIISVLAFVYVLFGGKGK